MPIDPIELASAIADAIGRGAIAGLGAGQNDSFVATDNVDATHALNIRYVIPSNSQRVVAAKLSFHLAPYRTYDRVAAAGLHTHTWVTSGAGVLNWTLGMDNAGVPKIGGAALPPPYGYTTASDVPVGVATGSAFTTVDVGGNAGHTHAQTLGVTEGATATGVTVKFDGVDKTSALGGGSGFTTDQVELDVTPYIQKLPDKAFHLIALTPNANGRIEAHLRLSYFANAGIPA